MTYNELKMLTDEELKELNEILKIEMERRQKILKDQAREEMEELIHKYEKLDFHFVVINENRYQQVMISPQNLEIW